MKVITVYVLCLPEMHLLDLAGPVQALGMCEDASTRFQLRYISPLRTLLSKQGLELSSLQALPEVFDRDSLLLIPGIESSHYATADESIDVALDWLRRHEKRFRKILAVCSGVMFLAKAGLLDGVECTTHHSLIEKVQTICPHAIVHEDRIFVEDCNIISCAGITSGIDMCLYLIECLLSPEQALLVARELVVYFRRRGRDPQLSIWLQYRNHIHPLVHKAQTQLIKNPAQDWSVKSLADEVGMSERNLSRAFKEHVGMTVLHYYQKTRLEVARNLIVQSTKNMEQIAHLAGFKDTKSFRRAWKNIIGGTPSEARRLNLEQPVIDA